jgi:hypothetical protein
MVKSITYYPKPTVYDFPGAVNKINPRTKEDRKRLVREIQDRGGVILPYYKAITIR